MGKRNAKKTVAKNKVSTQTSRKAPVLTRYSVFGWIVLGSPVLLILFLVTAGPHIPWIMEHSDTGAEHEASFHNSIGMEKMNAGQLREAYASFRTALTIKPDYVEAYINIAKVFYLRHNFDEAVNWLEQAIELHPPEIGLVYNNLAMLYAQQGQIERALPMFEQSLELGSPSVSLLRNIANAHYQLGHYDEAINVYRQVLELHPSVENEYRKMLYEVSIDYSNDEEREEEYRAATALVDHDFTQEELAVFDSTSIADMIFDVDRILQDYERLAHAQEEAGYTDDAALTRAEAREVEALHRRR